MTDKIVCNLKHNVFLEMFMENQDINLIVGQNLLKLRRSRKMTQLELAEKFNVQIISYTHIKAMSIRERFNIIYESSDFAV